MENKRDRLNRILEKAPPDWTKMDWSWISYNIQLSENYMRKNKDILDWKNISANQKLSESFMEEFQDKLDWFVISQSQIMSKSFIEKFKDKLDEKFLKKNLSLQLIGIEEVSGNIHVPIKK